MKTELQNPMSHFRSLVNYGIARSINSQRELDAFEREERRRQEREERYAKTDAFRARSLELQEMRLQNQAQNIELGFERDQTARDKNDIARDKNDIDRYKAVTDRFHKGEQDSIAHSKLALGYDQLGEKMREHDDTMAFKYYDAERKSEDARYKTDLTDSTNRYKAELADSTNRYKADLASQDRRYQYDLNSEDRLLKLDLNDARQGYEYDMAFNAMFPSPSPSLDLEDTFGEDYNMFWD